MNINGKYYHHIQETDCISIQCMCNNKVRCIRDRYRRAHRSAILSQSTCFSSSPKVIVPIHEIQYCRPKEEDGLRLHNAVIRHVCERRCKNAMSIGKTILFRKSAPRKNMTRFCTHALYDNARCLSNRLCVDKLAVTRINSSIFL